jgi:hypothetical protein
MSSKYLLQYVPFLRWFYSGDQFGSELWKDGQPAATKSESGKNNRDTVYYLKCIVKWHGTRVTRKTTPFCCH